MNCTLRLKDTRSLRLRLFLWCNLNSLRYARKSFSFRFKQFDFIPHIFSFLFTRICLFFQESQCFSLWTSNWKCPLWPRQKHLPSEGQLYGFRIFFLESTFSLFSPLPSTLSNSFSSEMGSLLFLAFDVVVVLFKVDSNGPLFEALLSAIHSSLPLFQQRKFL